MIDDDLFSFALTSRFEHLLFLVVLQRYVDALNDKTHLIYIKLGTAMSSPSLLSRIVRTARFRTIRSLLHRAILLLDSSSQIWFLSEKGVLLLVLCSSSITATSSTMSRTSVVSRQRPRKSASFRSTASARRKFHTRI